VRRTSAWVVLGVLSAVIGVAGCDRDDHPAASQCQLFTPPAAGQPGSPGVTVAEQGFTSVPPDFTGNAMTAPRVSIGAILQNNAGKVAYRTRVVFDALDDSGRSVVSGPQVNYQMIEVPVLLPGARAAVGDTLVAKEKARVARVSINTAVTGWLPAGGPQNGLAPITATVDPATSSRKDDGSAIVGFTTKNPNCADLLSRGMTFAWRDSGGKIVGGNVDALTKASACQTGGTEQPTIAMSQVNTAPETADPARTDLTALCDVIKVPVVVRSGRPIN
jgi:hypothetical protein